MFYNTTNAAARDLHNRMVQAINLLADRVNLATLEDDPLYKVLKQSLNLSEDLGGLTAPEGLGAYEEESVLNSWNGERL